MRESSPTPDEVFSPLAHLFHIARSQGYITYDQILGIWPDPEQALDQLERLFGALIAAEIPFGDEGASQAH